MLVTIYIYIYMTFNRIVDFINVTKINHLNMIIIFFLWCDIIGPKA
jgi:hypothetical protein